MRAAAAVLLLLLSAALCTYALRRHPVSTVDDYLADAGRFDGKPVYSPPEAVVGGIVRGGFILRWRGGQVFVRGTAPDLKSGEYVAVSGIFHREGYIDALEIHVGRFRRLKMAASLAAALIVCSLLWRSFRWDAERKALAIRERGD